MRSLKVGTRVRMKVQTASGWKGTGTVIHSTWTGVKLVKDGYPLHSDDGIADACRYDVAVLRDQTPPTQSQRAATLGVSDEQLQ